MDLGDGIRVPNMKPLWARATFEKLFCNWWESWSSRRIEVANDYWVVLTFTFMNLRLLFIRI